MITDEQVEAAVDYLRDNARKVAVAKGQSQYMDDFTKVVRAKIMRENPDKPLGVQEAIANSDQRFDSHIKAKATSIEEYEYLRWMMEAAQAKISVYQTQSANNRKGI